MRQVSFATLKKQFTISLIIGEAVMLIYFFVGVIGTFKEKVSMFDGLIVIVVLLLGVIILPFTIWSFLINGKKIMKGLFSFKPFFGVGFMKQYFKGIGYAVKGFVVLMKKEEFLMIDGAETTQRTN